MTVDPLFVDVYPLDGPKNWSAFIAAGPPFHGAIFKLSQGLRYEYTAWVYKQRQSFLASERYGHDLFDGLYHYLEVDTDGAKQAEWFWSLCRNVCGEKLGTLWAMVDVERGGQHGSLDKHRVEGCTRAFAERYEQLSGRKATLYGGELLRSIGVTDLLGCGRSAVALYGPELHGKGESTASFLKRTGTDLEHAMLWQYAAGEGPPTGPVGYPHEAPGCGRVDISVLVAPGGIAGLKSRLWAEHPDA